MLTGNNFIDLYFRNSSTGNTYHARWMNEIHTHDFAWQEGYGAFTVGISHKAHTIAYIRSQAEHHRRRSFEEEFVAFLKKHGVEYDPQYVWG